MKARKNAVWRASLSRPLLHFVTFCSKIFSSALLHSWFQEIRCQSSIKFDRLRSFPVFHRVLVTFSSRPSSFEFARVRPILNPTIPSRRAEVVSPRILLVFSTFYFLQNYSLAASAPLRISPQRLMAATKPGLAPSFEVPVPLLFAAGAIRNSFQDVKDQLSSSGFDFENLGEPKAVEWASARSK